MSEIDLATLASAGVAWLNASDHRERVLNKPDDDPDRIDASAIYRMCKEHFRRIVQLVTLPEQSHVVEHANNVSTVDWAGGRDLDCSVTIIVPPVPTPSHDTDRS